MLQLFPFARATSAEKYSGWETWPMVQNSPPITITELRQAPNSIPVQQQYAITPNVSQLPQRMADSRKATGNSVGRRRDYSPLPLMVSRGRVRPAGHRRPPRVTALDASRGGLNWTPSPPTSLSAIQK